MPVPDGFTVLERYSLTAGEVVIACKDVRDGVHIEIPPGPFSLRDARVIAESLVLGLDAFPATIRAQQRAAGMTP